MSITDKMPTIRRSLRPSKSRMTDFKPQRKPVIISSAECAAIKEPSVFPVQSELIHNSVCTVDTTHSPMNTIRHFTRRVSLAMKPNSDKISKTPKASAIDCYPQRMKRNSFQAWRRRASYSLAKAPKSKENTPMKQIHKDEITTKNTQPQILEFMSGTRKRPSTTCNKAMIPRRKSFKLDDDEKASLPPNGRNFRSNGALNENFKDSASLCDLSDYPRSKTRTEHSTDTESFFSRSSIKSSQSSEMFDSELSFPSTDSDSKTSVCLKAPATSTISRKSITNKNYKFYNYGDDSLFTEQDIINQRVGTTLFNIQPAKGISYLIDEGVVDMNPKSIAHYLKSDYFNRSSIGEYFGSLHDPLAPKVIKEMMNNLEMGGLKVDEALRLVLKGFRPMGESQKISHLLTQFREVYVSKNSEEVEKIFRSQDTIETLSYSILMLHTSHFNPNASKNGQKINLASFLHMNSRIDNDQALPDEYIKGVYNRVTSQELQCSPDITNTMKELDKVITGPKKSESFLLPYRRFIGWAFVHEVDMLKMRNAIKNEHRHLRAMFVFNDIVLLTKGSNYGSIGRSHHDTLSGSHSSLSSVSKNFLSFSKSPTRGHSPAESFQAADTATSDIPIRGKYVIKTIIRLSACKLGKFNSFGNSDGIVLATEQHAFHLVPFTPGDVQSLNHWLDLSIKESTLIHNIMNPNSKN